MNEPENHTGWVDKSGGIWVRVDECPGQYGNWWPICGGPGWDPAVKEHPGQAREWQQVLVDWPELTPADPGWTARAVALVREDWAR